MAHKHLCLNCSAVIEQGEFDCDDDRDHDWAYCNECVASEVSAND